MSTKIHRCKANEMTYEHSDFIIGMAGPSDLCLEISDFFQYPETYGKPPKIPKDALYGLVVTDEGIFHFTNPGKWLRVQDKYFAIGSGSLTALGALSVGATPKQAVLAASKIDPFTGMGTKVLKL